MCTCLTFASTCQHHTSRRATSGTHTSKVFKMSSHACAETFYAHANRETMPNNACDHAAATTHTLLHTDVGTLAPPCFTLALPCCAVH